MRRSAPVVEGIAATVARTLLRHVEHQGDRYDPGSWVAAARALGARVLRFTDPADGAAPGYYAWTPHGGTIFYNGAADPHAVCRRLCHELAHHLFADWTGGVYRRTRPERYDDDVNSFQHRVARRVEVILLGELK